MSQQEYKRLCFQICDVLTYFSFPSLSPFTRDRQKNKNVKQHGRSVCTCLCHKATISLLLEHTWWDDSLKSRCTTYKVSCVNLASSPFGLLIVNSYFMHLLLVPECLSIIQVLRNWNYPSFIVVHTLMYCGKQRYDREEDGRPKGGEDEERFHGSTAFSDQWIYPDTFFQLSAAITGRLLFTFLCLWT